MGSSALPQENGDFQTIQTPQGSVLVSSCLLTTSNAATEETLTGEIYGSVPFETQSAPVMFFPHAPEDDAALAFTRPLNNVYSKTSATTVHSSLPYKDGDSWMVATQPCALNFLGYEHSQEEPSVPAAQPLDRPCQVDVLLRDTSKAEEPAAGAGTSSPPSGMPVLTVSSNARQPSHGATTRDDDGQRIPSYMTPEAIRARNLILHCNRPTPNKMAADICTSPNGSFCQDTSTLRKRKKLYHDCCNS